MRSSHKSWFEWTTQIYRLKKGSVSFLIHKNTNTKPSHAFDDNFKQRIINLKKTDKYKDANFKHFQELLLEHEGISISYNALCNLLTSNSIVSPEKSRKSKQHNRRKKKARKGMLIQMDATPFEWFGALISFLFMMLLTMLPEKL